MAATVASRLAMYSAAIPSREPLGLTRLALAALPVSWWTAAAGCGVFCATATWRRIEAAAQMRRTERIDFNMALGDKTRFTKQTADASTRFPSAGFLNAANRVGLVLELERGSWEVPEEQLWRARLPLRCRC